MGKNRERYVGGDDNMQMELDEHDLKIVEENRREKRKRLIIAVIAILAAAVVVSVYFIVVRGATGKSQSRELVKTYMEGLDEADLDKVCSVMDPDTIDSNSSNDLVTVFQTYKENNIKYSVDYIMEEGYEAADSDIEAVSNTIYGKDAKTSNITKGYVVPVTGTINMTYQGQTSPYDLDMDIICYEKDGNWYLGGTVVSGSDAAE